MAAAINIVLLGILGIVGLIALTIVKMMIKSVLEEKFGYIPALVIVGVGFLFIGHLFH